MNTDSLFHRLFQRPTGHGTQGMLDVKLDLHESVRVSWDERRAPHRA